MRNVLAVLALFIAPSLFAQVSFVGQTAGGSFGSSGQATALKTPSLPSFVSSFTPQGASTYTWSDGVTTWYSPASESFVISGTGSYNVTLFAKDDDSTARVETIQAGSTTQQISSFHGGVYLTYTVTGNATFKITVKGGANAVLTSVFFDPAPGTVTPPPCPTPKVTLFWNASPGATGYNVYQNGIKLTGAPIAGLSYTIGGLASGTYSVQITAVNAQGESPLSGSLPVTIP